MRQDQVDLEVAVIRNVEIPAEVTDDAVSGLVGHCLAEEEASGPWQVAIAFVDDSEICSLHQQFMGDPEPTDILTFAYDEPDNSGGDIAICVPVAAEHARDLGSSAADELEFLVLHGILHLLGYDDASPEDRSAMLGRQQAIFDSWKMTTR